MAWPSFRFKPNDIFNTTLDGVITGATDPIPVIDNTDAEDGPGTIALENEIVKYTTKGSNEFSTLTRGYNGTEATSHASGVAVTHPISADLINKLTDAVEALYGGALDIIAAKGDTLVGTAADTLGKLAIGAANTLFYVNADTPGWATAEALSISRHIVTEIADSATPTPARASFKTMLVITALDSAAELRNPTGTPVMGDLLWVSILDDGTGRALTYDTEFVTKCSSSLPSTTTAGKELNMLFKHNDNDNEWGLIATDEEA